MPRVNYVKAARKDYPSHGIKKGESYYWWKFRYGGKHKSRTMPRQSQLTQSDKLSRVYEAQESVDDATGLDAAAYSSPDDYADAVESVADIWRSAAETLREVAEEYEESASNMEEYFQGSSQVDEIREKGDNLQSDADTADGIADEWSVAADEIRAIEYDEEIDEESPDYIDWRDEADTIVNNLDTSLDISI